VLRCCAVVRRLSEVIAYGLAFLDHVIAVASDFELPPLRRVRDVLQRSIPANLYVCAVALAFCLF
jgi:hypothetical protein